MRCRTTPKPWGHEVYAYHAPDEQHPIEVQTVKLLHLDHGASTSKHQHRTKCELFVVVSGSLRLTIWPRDKTGSVVVRLNVGARYYLPAGTWHRLTAASPDTVILEVSTLHSEEDTERQAL